MTLNEKAALAEQAARASGEMLEHHGNFKVKRKSENDFVTEMDYRSEALIRDMLLAGEEFGAQWYCAGAITKKGHPHHPLYLRKDEKIKPFDVEHYLNTLT